MSHRGNLSCTMVSLYVLGCVFFSSPGWILGWKYIDTFSFVKGSLNPSFLALGNREEKVINMV